MSILVDAEISFKLESFKEFESLAAKYKTDLGTFIINCAEIGKDLVVSEEKKRQNKIKSE